jgi:hypothetical protein
MSPVIAGTFDADLAEETEIGRTQIELFVRHAAKAKVPLFSDIVAS